MIENNTTWIGGKHSVTFGGTMIQADVWLENQTLVPTVGFGLVSTEPATAMFNAANFPGASAADIAQAQNLYAILTGRVTSLTGDARINESGDAYVPLGKSRAAGRMREFDLLRRRQLARDADADDQRRLALRAAEAVLPGEQQLHDDDGSRVVRAVG